MLQNTNIFCAKNAKEKILLVKTILFMQKVFCAKKLYTMKKNWQKNFFLRK